MNTHHITAPTSENGNNQHPPVKKGRSRASQHGRLPFLRVAAFAAACLFAIGSIWMCLTVPNHWQLLDIPPGPYYAAPDTQPRPKFAIISGFVTKDTSKDAPQVKNTMLGHLVNKACYAHLWGYDFIFNTTWGFDKSLSDRHWLDYGTWHRVPHMQAALAKYEWILYADVDYVVQDLTVPLESFLKEWELHGKNDVHVLVPDDGNSLHTFSAFAVFIRNAPFGHRLLENWMELGKGLCKNGNFPSKPGKYEWGDSDQPGLWYALAKTHSEFFPQDGANYQIECNETTGLAVTDRFLGPELNTYMRKVNAVLGSHGADLIKVPDEQPILWSKQSHETRSGLGVQLAWGIDPQSRFPNSFGLHTKSNLPPNMMRDLDICRKVHGCFANYTDQGKLEIGCEQNQSMVYYEHARNKTGISNGGLEDLMSV